MLRIDTSALDYLTSVCTSRRSWGGLVGSDADKEKAAGVNVNLWVGIALLLACAVFWAWALARPLSEELTETGQRRRA